MKYVMVTDFDKHWDKIKGNLTSYPPKMVKKGKPDELIYGVDTIFIKKYKDTDEIEKTWSGKIHDIQRIPGSIFLCVEIEKVYCMSVDKGKIIMAWNKRVTYSIPA